MKQQTTRIADPVKTACLNLVCENPTLTVYCLPACAISHQDQIRLEIKEVQS